MGAGPEKSNAKGHPGVRPGCRGTENQPGWLVSRRNRLTLTHGLAKKFSQETRKNAPIRTLGMLVNSYHKFTHIASRLPRYRRTKSQMPPLLKRPNFAICLPEKFNGQNGGCRLTPKRRLSPFAYPDTHLHTRRLKFAICLPKNLMDKTADAAYLPKDSISPFAHQKKSIDKTADAA